MTATATESPTAGRSVPLISPAPLIPAADFGPTDRLQGWLMTAVITGLAAISRFLNLGSPTDAGTPVFDEKHYAPQAWQMLYNHGVEDNPGYGLVVHRPSASSSSRSARRCSATTVWAGGSPARCAVC